MSYLDDLEKTLEKGTRRWQEIEELYKHISNNLSSFPSEMIPVIELQLLLIDHLRPITPTKEQLDDVNQELKSILSSFLKK